MSTNASREGFPITNISPLPRPLSGDATVPGDKSISHRAVLFSAMAEGTSRISGLLDSADVRSSISAVSALGARCDFQVADDGSLEGSVTGWGAKGPSQPEGPVYCGNSGTTVRLLMGVLAPWGISVELTGDESLSRRPMKRIFAPLSQMGARFEPEGQTTLPLIQTGTADLTAIDYQSPVASAQLKSALLIAGAFAKGRTSVCEPAPSRNHTELMLPEYGVAVEARDCFAAVEGGASMHAADAVVPGDPSSAAFIACACALKAGSEVTIRNVALGSARIGFVRVLERMGVRISAENQAEPGREPRGDIRVAYTEGIRACRIEGSEIASLVDELPVLALVAAFAEGESVFCEAGELRVKETDRFQAIIDGLAQLGIRAWGEGDDLHIQGNPNLEVPAGLLFDSLGDHRLAMTWSLVGLCGSVAVDVRDFESVCVSYPRFLQDIERLAR